MANTIDMTKITKCAGNENKFWNLGKFKEVFKHVIYKSFKSIAKSLLFILQFHKFQGLKLYCASHIKALDELS